MVLRLLSTFEISFHEHFKAIDNAIRKRVAVTICLACGVLQSIVGIHGMKCGFTLPCIVVKMDHDWVPSILLMLYFYCLEQKVTFVKS